MMKILTNHRWLLVVFIGLISFTLGCRVVIRNTTPPPAPCPIEGLLINESVIPDEWYFSMSGDPSTLFGVEFETVFFNSSYGGGIQDVYREWTKEKATRSYNGLVESFFHPNAQPAEWILPSEFTYQSQVADQVQLGCSTTFVTGREDCQFIAQYGIYVTRFQATISEVLTYDDFETILEDIDQRMAKCLTPQTK